MRKIRPTLGPPILDVTPQCSLIVLMPIETLGDALTAGWRVHAKCIDGRVEQTHSTRKCHYTKELNLETLVWTRGRKMPLSDLKDRMMPAVRGSAHQHHFRSQANCSNAGRVGPSDVQSLFLDQGPGGDTRAVPRPARPHRQPAFLSRGLPRPDGSYRPQCRRWQSGARTCTLGHAGTSAVRRRASHKHPQRLKPALAGLALA